MRLRDSSASSLMSGSTRTESGTVTLSHFLVSSLRVVVSLSLFLSLLLRLPLSVPFVFLSLGLGSSTRGALLSRGEAGRRYIQGVAVVAEVEVEVVWMCGWSVEEWRGGAGAEEERWEEGEGRRENGVTDRVLC